MTKQQMVCACLPATPRQISEASGLTVREVNQQLYHLKSVGKATPTATKIHHPTGRRGHQYGRVWAPAKPPSRLTTTERVRRLLPATCPEIAVQIDEDTHYTNAILWNLKRAGKARRTDRKVLNGNRKQGAHKSWLWVAT